jgi:hypothetical protein
VPFLRITRDKRGYENTFLMHAVRRRGQPPSILYWFRTPPNVRVGRAALDEEAIRALEETHPEVTFDWPAILKTPPEILRGPQERRASRNAPRAPKPAALPSAAAPSASEERVSEPRSEGSIVAPAGVEASVDDRPGMLSSEQIAILRGRYAALLARISQRVSEPARLEALREQAASLDPDTWVTAEEVRAHLEDYEAVYQNHRTSLGGDRRRPPRRRGSRRGEGSLDGGEGTVSGPRAE